MLLSYFFPLDLAAAAREFKRAVELDPGSSDALQEQSRSAETFARFGEALDLARAAVARDPLNAWAYETTGRAELTLDQLAEAEASGRKALELAPGSAVLHYELGSVLLARNQPAAALTEIEREPSPIFYHLGRTRAFYALGRTTEADREFATLQQEHGDGWAFQIAEVYAEQHNPEQAFAWLDRAYRQQDSGLVELRFSRRCAL